jgi:hypothetical protein
MTKSKAIRKSSHEESEIIKSKRGRINTEAGLYDSKSKVTIAGWEA